MAPVSGACVMGISPFTLATELLMPGFHHSFAVLPLPFRRCRSVVPLCHAIVPLPFFRSTATVAVAGENGNAGNVFPCT